MQMFKATLFGSAIAVLSSTTAIAACPVEAGSIRILSNDFAALHAVSDGAEACAGEGVEVVRNHTTDHREIQVAALTANPAEYTIVRNCFGLLIYPIN